MTGEMISQINIGSGKDISIKDLAFLLKKIINYRGDIIFNDSYPDGTPQKLLDISKINSLGWVPQYSLEEGLFKTYEWYLQN